MELILALVVVTVLLMPPLSLLLVLLTRSRLKRLEREVRVLTDTSTDLQVRLAGLDRDPARAPDALEPEQPPIAPAQVPVATEAPPPRPPDLRRPATPPLPTAPIVLPDSPVTEAAPESRVEPVPGEPEVADVAVPVETPPLAVPTPGFSASAPPPTEPDVSADPQPLEPPPPAVTAAGSVEPARQAEVSWAQRTPRQRPRLDWESLVGVKLFSWIAGVAVVVAAVSFLRYSIDQGWLQPQVRMAIGLLTGVALLVVCELRIARNYRITANAMHGAAIAVLFATFFAGHVVWSLVPAVPTFGFMALVAAVAVALAVRRDSVFIALLGLVGGFATPFLLSTGLDRPVALFGYLVILNAGLAWVAYHRNWPILTAISVLLTVVHQWAWVLRFLTASELGLAAGVFLVFPVLAFVARSVASRFEAVATPGTLFDRAASLSAVLPLLFALFMATVPAYGDRFGVLFSFLLVFAVGLFALSVWRGPRALHAVGALSTLLVFAVWMALSYADASWPSVLVWLGVFVFFFLVAPVVAERVRRPLSGQSAASVYAAPLLLFVVPALVVVEPRCAWATPLIGALVLYLAAIATFAVLRGRGGLYLVGAVAAVTAEAVWSAFHVSLEQLPTTLTLYVVFVLFFLGVPVLARRVAKPLQPRGGTQVALLLSLGLLLFLATGSVAAQALWGIALLLALIGAGMLVEGAHGRLAGLTIAGTVVSWIVLAVWWVAAPAAERLGPGLAVVCGYAVLVVAGGAWAARRATVTARGRPGALVGVMAFGLVGHLFLVVVAAQPELALPPWPLLAVLAVIDLAIAVAALVCRRGALHSAAMVFSGLVLMVFLGSIGSAPWPEVAIAVAVALAAFAVLWMVLAQRVAGDDRKTGNSFAVAAVIALAVGHAVTMMATTRADQPGLALLVGAHVAFAVAVLAIARWREWHLLAVVETVPAFFAVMLWIGTADAAGWQQRLLFAGVMYALFISYPLLVGRRATGALWPWVAPVVASAFFFVIARGALEDGGLGSVIGILPVAQAAVLGVLVARLLRLEPPGRRDLGRLVLVVGAVLAFVTGAIPLQLDRQWITIGWAVEGVVLAWLYRRVPHRGFLATSVALLGTAFVRLALNPEVLDYYPRGEVPVLNWYLYTFLAVAAAIYAAAFLLRPTDDRLLRGTPPVSRWLPALGTVLLFLLVNIEIADFFSRGPRITFAFAGASLGQDLSYTLAWAVFAIGLLISGVVLSSRVSRVASIALLVVTVLKAFLHDLAQLGGLYRVGSFIGLAVSLALVAVALQRFVLSQRDPEGESSA